MSLNAKNVPQESKFKTPDALEPGGYPSRVVNVIGLGLQKQDPYQGEEKPPKQELMVTYEMADEFLLDEDGEEIKDKPRWISEVFTLNSLESDLAKSTKRYYAIDPSEKYGGDFAELVGAPAIVNIVCNEGKGKHKGKTFNNVSSVTTVRTKEADKMPPLVNEGKVFDFYDPNLETFLSFSTYVQDRIKGSLDFEGSELEKLLEAHTGGPSKSEGGSDQKASKASEKPAPEADDGEDW